MWSQGRPGFESLPLRHLKLLARVGPAPPDDLRTTLTDVRTARAQLAREEARATVRLEQLRSRAAVTMGDVRRLIAELSRVRSSAEGMLARHGQPTPAGPLDEALIALRQALPHLHSLAGPKA
jgi:hypothetical protein